MYAGNVELGKISIQLSDVHRGNKKSTCSKSNLIHEILIRYSHDLIDDKRSIDKQVRININIIMVAR